LRYLSAFVGVSAYGLNREPSAQNLLDQISKVQHLINESVMGSPQAALFEYA
jgi:hypothetical protein